MGKAIDRFIARTLLVGLALTLAAVLGACSHSGSSAAPAPAAASAVPAVSAEASAAARVSAMASSTAAARAKANLLVISGRCGTTTATGQIAAVKELASHDGRQKLWAKCGVPEAKRPVVEAQALDAAEKGHLVSGGKAARATYFEVTLPKIILAAQS